MFKLMAHVIFIDWLPIEFGEKFFNKRNAIEIKDIIFF